MARRPLPVDPHPSRGPHAGGAAEAAARRSYQQLCPMGYALDVVGDRWTLLLLRELLYGPRRYSDLKRGLPGMATNLLAARLRELEQRGLLEPVQLPPPGAVAAYALTDYGRTARSLVMAMTEWGMHLVPTLSRPDDHLSVISAVSMMEILYRGSGGDLRVELRPAGEVFTLDAGPDRLAVAPGTADEPDLVLEGSPRGLLTLALSPAARPLPEGMVQRLAGGKRALSAFRRRFPDLPEAFLETIAGRSLGETTAD